MGTIARWSVSKFGYDFGKGLAGPFLIIFLQQIAGGSIKDAGLILAVMMLLHSVLVGPFGWLSDKVGRRGLLLLGGFIDSYALYLLSTVSLINELYWLVALFSVGGGMRAGALAPFEMDMSEGKLMGTTLSAVMLVSDLAMAMAVVAGGYLLDIASFEQLFLIAAVLMFVSNLGIFFINPSEVRK